MVVSLRTTNIMDTNILTTTKTTLTLNENEVKWLKEIMQTPLHDNESPQDQNYRRQFWIALGGN